jgi:hypothetical protein
MYVIMVIYLKKCLTGCSEIMCRSLDYKQESRRKCQMCTGLEPFSVGKFALHRDTIPGSARNLCICIVLNVGPCNMGGRRY